MSPPREQRLTLFSSFYSGSDATFDGIGTLLVQLCIVALPFGYMSSLHVPGSLGKLLVSEVIVIVFIVWLFLGQVRTPFGGLRLMGVAFLLCWALLPAAIINYSTAASWLAYANWGLGLILGVSIGNYWVLNGWKRFNPIDVALVLFLAIACCQLSVTFLSAPTWDVLHQYSELPWGNSNYVAGVLVVTAFALIGRVTMTNASLFVLVVPALALVLAGLTFSRGGLVAIFAGSAYALWLGLSRFRLRPAIMALAVGLGAWALISAMSAIEASRGARAELNVQIRLELYQIAWRGFVSSPLFGDGWVGLRFSSARFARESHSFAHNVFLSFLNIGGVFALFFLCFLVYCGFVACRLRSLVFGGFLAAVAVSMSDPFFEGYVAGAVSIAIVSACCCAKLLDDDDFAARVSNSADTNAVRLSRCSSRIGIR